MDSSPCHRTGHECDWVERAGVIYCAICDGQDVVTLAPVEVLRHPYNYYVCFAAHRGETGIVVEVEGFPTSTDALSWALSMLGRTAYQIDAAARYNHGHATIYQYIAADEPMTGYTIERRVGRGPCDPSWQLSGACNADADERVSGT
jgi:hypothetical protein